MRQVIEKANGTSLNGRTLTVNEARPKAPAGSYGRDRREQ
jgi:RNA recognition motif-containing protein